MWSGTGDMDREGVLSSDVVDIPTVAIPNSNVTDSVANVGNKRCWQQRDIAGLKPRVATLASLSQQVD
jgi:hypothetical protein